MSLDETRKSLLHGRDIQIAAGTLVQLRLLGMEARCRSTLVGMEPDDYLIIRTPMVPGILNRLRNGNRVTVSCLISGRVCGFQSSVLGHVMKPVPLMFLSYPRTVETYELRKEQRVSCLFPANAQISGQRFQGVILDISKGGCRFSSDVSCNMDISKIGMGESVNLILQWLGVEEEQVLAGSVRSKSQDFTKTVVGIEFEQAPSTSAGKIEAYVSSVTQFIGH
jgi:c-di-GMP-binding flagellar brake protein YcgR